LRVFRAPDDPAACERYSKSHREVLECFDIGGVTSSGGDWSLDPNVLVTLVEDARSCEALAGIRLERAGRARPLPIERALADIEPEARLISSSAVPGGVAELCALWSSRRLRGAGMGPLLTRIGFALAVQRGIGKLFGVCDTRSLETNLGLGFEIERGWADRGRFRYPRPDLTAYVLSADLELWRRPERLEYRQIREFCASQPGGVTRQTRAGQELWITWDLRCASTRRRDVTRTGSRRSS
jgi:hypothetical protein